MLSSLKHRRQTLLPSRGSLEVRSLDTVKMGHVHVDVEVDVLSEAFEDHIFEMQALYNIANPNWKKHEL